jgi:amino acid transporter
MINLIALLYLLSVIGWVFYIKKIIKDKGISLDEVAWIAIIGFAGFWLLCLPLAIAYKKRQKAIIQKKKELEELVK